jgi:hypothetical protein
MRMKGTKKGIVLGVFLSVVHSGAAAAEPSYLIYPNAPAVFHYDTGRYELVATGNPKFDPRYAIGNQMLWDRVAGRVPVEVYRAPQLVGFEPSAYGRNEFVVYRNDFELVIDGFSEGPHTVGNLCLRFWPVVGGPGALAVSLGGQFVDRLTVRVPSLEVSTPVDDQFYSDTQTHALAWMGSTAIRIIAFSDKDGNRAFDGTPLFAVVARDATVPVSRATWGGIKSLYR